MQWQDEKSVEDVILREQNRPDTGFLSWSNYIKQHKDDAPLRYEVAQQFLPWPLGFKESVLALRAMIRGQKKQQGDYQRLLWRLYQLAAWESFYPKQSDRVGEPGFKVFVQFPGAKVTGLEMDYRQLGYQQLKLLTKTDAKMLVALYGEPQAHSTLYDLYPQVWAEAEDWYLAHFSKEAVDSTKPEYSAQPSQFSSAAGISSAAKKYTADGQLVPIFWSRDKKMQKQMLYIESATKATKVSSKPFAKLKNNKLMARVRQILADIKPRQLFATIQAGMGRG